ncbi:MAG TPA: HAMP domain-containing sensor histidine kinase [Gemmatimonadales bacterium]|jgi:signal transduction histidine kinase|nr:HAMP domain-containing sensor histidine kinase [Gemmatimonadales bacterium]
MTVWYATALILSIGVFAVVLYLTRRSATYQDLDRRIQSEADLTAGILAESYHARGTLVKEDTAGRPVLPPEVAAVLEVVPDYLLVTSRDGRLLFASPDARALTFAEFEQLNAITRPLATSAQPQLPGRFRIEPNGPTLHYIVRAVPDAGDQFGAIFAAANTQSAELRLDQLLLTLVIAFFVGVVPAILVGGWIAGRALEPVDRMITEVREITDGRSLHRRLAVPMERDELGRLAETLNQMMTRLERSFAALRRFTADASHELKTPLTVVRAGVERAITRPDMPPETLAPLEETLQEVNRMTELLDSLLTLARADEGRAELHREPIDLREILEEAGETGELLAEHAGVGIDIRLPPDPVVVTVDRSRMRQLALNLIENAVKYTPSGGHVSVELGGSDGRAVFTVADTGIGIAPGDLPHVFDRFWRADSARTRTSERAGTGLGLAICKWIAEAHGGTIEVQSRPGRGTTFTVGLPRG